MERNDHRTASYRIIADAGGSRYRFFCDVSGMAMCTTKPLPAVSAEHLLQAWETEGRPCFNRCNRCGKWVSDVMYNADTGQCILCSPWEEQPLFCPDCGNQAPLTDLFCSKCGRKLQYKEEEKAEHDL